MTLRRLHSLALIASITLLSSGALAQMEPDDNRQLAYEGHLDLNGAPVTGAHDFRFALFATEAADASCLGLSTSDACDAASLWWAEHPGTTVAAGSFSVTLGATKSLGDGVLKSAELWLAIAVRQGSDPFTVLQGKQKLLAVPFAARAAAAKDYKVSGNLTVAGTASVTGKLTTGEAEFTGATTFSNTATFNQSATFSNTATFNQSANFTGMATMSQFLVSGAYKTCMFFPGSNPSPGAGATPCPAEWNYAGQVGFISDSTLGCQGAGGTVGAPHTTNWWWCHMSLCCAE